MEEKNQNKYINIEEIVCKLWKHRKQFFITLPAVLVGTYLFMLLIPRYYTCELKLAPESSNASMGGTLSSIASSVGLSGLDKMAMDDAISPELYPDLLESNNFLVTLFPIQVKTKDGELCTNYYEYIKKHQALPFWEKFIINPIIDMFSPTAKSNFKGTDSLAVRNMTKPQQEVAMAIAGKLKCTIDKKTDVITITVKDQDPEVCATIGDSVLYRLQSFIVDYRTKKARNDYNYYKKLYDQAKADYDRSRKAYSRSADANTNAVLHSTLTKIEELENDMQLQYTAFTTLSNQMRLAHSKIQENTPAFTAIETATVPFRPAGPKRTLTALIVTILAGIALSIKILVREKE